MLDESKINEAYRIAETERNNYYFAGEQAIEAKATLEKRKAIGLQSGEIEGKNAEMREASAMNILATEYATLNNAEKEERKARCDFDLANLEVSRVQALLRLMEVLKE